MLWHRQGVTHWWAIYISVSCFTKYSSSSSDTREPSIDPLGLWIIGKASRRWFCLERKLAADREVPNKSTFTYIYRMRSLCLRSMLLLLLLLLLLFLLSGNWGRLGLMTRAGSLNPPRKLLRFVAYPQRIMSAFRDTLVASMYCAQPSRTKIGRKPSHEVGTVRRYVFYVVSYWRWVFRLFFMPRND